ncbi:phytoene dehydrogenase [Rhodospirillum rubrum]|uniref:phytoene desaturase n=1 Tax=Rhodospirillum rubrum TaxID=1085 RepID=UPI0019034F25|nr:phytoene desaturase [Rhodospirillum rubrum]MBK1663351.1 phytoene dehydrogenase [Rhodospirillum rubrum]MBK1676896.1 phytoene dehydrogenase [Rhodospirillum rubrum]
MKLHPAPTVPTQDRRPHAVVIGSGFGGLAAAVRLGARGYRVTVLEKLGGPGGRGGVFKQDGFTFDAGPTIVTLPSLFEELWTLCGRQMSDDVDLRPLTPFYTIRFNDGETFRAQSDPEAMRAEVARLSPGDVEGYERFIAESEDIYKVGFEQMADKPFSSITDMLKVVPQMLKLGALRSVWGHVAKHVADPRLRIALSFHPLFIGGNPLSVTSIYSMIAFLERRWGVHFAMGGTHSLVKGLVGLIEGQGNHLRYNAGVAEILVKNDRACGVRMETGEEIAADIVVSNADSAATYKNLLPAAHRRWWSDRRLAWSRYSMSLFIWHFGTKGTYPDVAHHTILMGPRYHTLIADIFQAKTLAKDFSLYLYRPTATDPSMAPKGCDSFYVLSPVPHLGGGQDWALEAEPYRKAILAELERTVLPGLGAKIVTSKVVTPVDFRDGLSSLNGAAFGLEPAFTQSAWFRPHNKSEEIDRLYLVGAGTHPGAGLPGVLSSAKILDTVVPDASVLV